MILSPKLPTTAKVFFKASSHTFFYKYFLNLFMRHGKFLKSFILINNVLKKIHTLIFSKNFIKQLSIKQRAAILSLQTSFQSSVLFELFSYFLFSLFLEHQLLFCVNVTYKTQNKRKQYQMEYKYVQPIARIFKSTRLFHLFVLNLKKKTLQKKLTYAFCDVLTNRGDNFFTAYKAHIVKNLIKKYKYRVNL